MTVETSPQPQKKPIADPLEKLIPQILEALEHWSSENSGESLKKKVFKKLDSDRDEILLKLMGFTASWGKWSVDNCNGRAGNSIVGDFMREQHKEVLQEWLIERCTPVMSPTIKKEIAASVRAAYVDRMRYAARELAVKRAELDLSMLIDELNLSGNLPKYIQTMQLLTQGSEG